MKCKPYRQPGRKPGRNGQELFVCCRCCDRDNGGITIKIGTSVSHDMLSSRKTWVDGKCRCNAVGWALGPFVIIFSPAPGTPVLNRHFPSARDCCVPGDEIFPAQVWIEGGAHLDNSWYDFYSKSNLGQHQTIHVSNRMIGIWKL